jgi:hypothetical protein
MIVLSNLSKEAYLEEFRSQVKGNYFCFGEERFTGFVIGNFFSIAYHSGYEWNRRYTNEKNRAIGFVRKNGAGCKVYAVRLRGYTNPLSLIILFAVFLGLFALDQQNYASGWERWFNPTNIWFALLGTVISAGISAAAAALTERGQQGWAMVTSLLHCPDDYLNQWFKYYHY